MKILIINKFLHPNGGSETYVFKLGKALQDSGHDVQFFGMKHPNRCVGNSVNAYTSEMNFHGGNFFQKIIYAFKTIYSREARVQIRKVLDFFKPDVCHLNNFNYQLTPSIILEIVKWRKQTGRKCKIIFTAHDYQLLCPNHMMNNPNTHNNCEKCIGRRFYYCVQGRCIHGSFFKSFIGAVEAYFWNFYRVYKYIDIIICPSLFMKSKMDLNPYFKNKTVFIRNFIDKVEFKRTDKKDYVLYFGRYSWEKGVRTLIEAAKLLPNIQFVFAGKGEYESTIKEIPNIKNIGYQTGASLKKVIGEARFAICPSECYENCPFSVLESLSLGTPVLGSSFGGVPELIEIGKTGNIFEGGSVVDLKNKIDLMWHDSNTFYYENCIKTNFIFVDSYVNDYLRILRKK